MFTLHHQTSNGRRGTLHTPHGDIQTPFFLPVATGGAMRGITLDDLKSLGAQVLLCNTYHLHLRPGEDIIQNAGGLHRFIGWDSPILTDSGGFQVFSLRHRLKIAEHGVHFDSHIDGSPLFIGPQEAMRIQHALQSDIMMCFDDCPPSTAPRKRLLEAVDRTLRWAKECKRWHEKLSFPSPGGGGSGRGAPLLFAIVQGGLERDLREKCTQELIAMGFDGYAIGGLAVGESEDEMYGVLDSICPMLPPAQPRYLMGVGRLSQLKNCIAKGIDMFDCVLPMREARHGTIHTASAKGCGWETFRITKKEFRNDHSLIDPDSPSTLSRHHTKAYLHHLFQTHERYAETIACMQNMGVILKMFRDLQNVMVSPTNHDIQNPP